MGSVNRVVILGLIGHAPELKRARNGKSFVHLSLSTHKRTKDIEGNDRHETQWHKVMIWGKNAENCAIYCGKGSALYVEGHLAPYSKTENGLVSHHISIVADQIQFVPGSKAAQAASQDEIDARGYQPPLPEIPADDVLSQRLSLSDSESTNQLN